MVDALPDCLEVSAESDDGVVMAVEHRSLPVAAVQFHPEKSQQVGLRILRNFLGLI